MRRGVPWSRCFMVSIFFCDTAGRPGGPAAGEVAGEGTRPTN
jgi:hypothetical protein